MQLITKEFWQCETCGEEYSSVKEAKSCESRPVSMDKGVKVGDEVMITRGDGAGQRGKVEKISIVDKYWGHYAYERYWHTIALDVKVIGGWGNRFLTFDDYKLI